MSRNPLFGEAVIPTVAGAAAASAEAASRNPLFGEAVIPTRMLLGSKREAFAS